jgi:hypothetical protein
MGIADYPEDCFDLTATGTLEERRNAFREFVNRPFYYTCGHCEKGGYGDAPSALQGKIDVFDKNTYKNRVWEKFMTEKL